MSERFFGVLRRHFLLAAALSYGLFLLLRLANSHAGNAHSSLLWLLTQYHISYFEFGFARRALVGTLLYPIMNLFPDGGAGERLVIIGLDIATVAAIVCMAKVALDRLDADHRGFCDLVRTTIVFSPVGLAEAAYDVGRFDHIGFLLTIVAAYLAVRRRYGLATVPIVAGMLAHEAAVLYGAPVLLSVMLIERQEMWRIAVVFAPVALAAAVIVLFGAIDADIVAALGPDLAEGREVWQRGLFETALKIKAKYYPAAILYTVPPLYYLYRFGAANGISPANLLLPAAIPLSLFVFGLDYFRWTHILFVFTSVLMATLASMRPYRLPQLNRLEKLAFVAYVIPLGPVGIATPLPLLPVYLGGLF